MLRRFVVAVFFSKAHMRFLLGHKSLAESFLHRYLAAFDEAAQGWQHALHACQRLLQLLDALRLMVGERTENLLLSAQGSRTDDGRMGGIVGNAFFIVCLVGLVVCDAVFRKHHKRFALKFQSGGQCGLHHLAWRTHIIMGHPTPHFELRREQKRRFVHHFQNFLYLYARGGRGAGTTHNDGGVLFALAERHYHTAAHSDLACQAFRQGIGEGTRQGEGQDDINEEGGGHGGGINGLLIGWGRSLAVYNVK